MLPRAIRVNNDQAETMSLGPTLERPNGPLRLRHAHTHTHTGAGMKISVRESGE